MFGTVEDGLKAGYLNRPKGQANDVIPKLAILAVGHVVFRHVMWQRSMVSCNETEASTTKRDSERTYTICGSMLKSVKENSRNNNARKGHLRKFKYPHLGFRFKLDFCLFYFIYKARVRLNKCLQQKR